MCKKDSKLGFCVILLSLESQHFSCIYRELKVNSHNYCKKKMVFIIPEQDETESSDAHNGFSVT